MEGGTFGTKPDSGLRTTRTGVGVKDVRGLEIKDELEPESTYVVPTLASDHLPIVADFVDQLPWLLLMEARESIIIVTVTLFMLMIFCP